MLAILPWEWERVYTPIVIFLDDLTFENAVLFSTRHYQQLCSRHMHASATQVCVPNYFSELFLSELIAYQNTMESDGAQYKSSKN